MYKELETGNDDFNALANTFDVHTRYVKLLFRLSVRRTLSVVASFIHALVYVHHPSIITYTLMRTDQLLCTLHTNHTVGALITR